MHTRRDALKIVPALVLGAIVTVHGDDAQATVAAAPESESTFKLYTMLLHLGPEDTSTTWVQSEPGSVGYSPDSQLIRFFKEGIDRFWKEHPNAAILQGDQVAFHFYDAEGSLWGQKHDIKADLVQVVEMGRYAIIDRALCLLRAQVNTERKAQGLPKITDFAGLQSASVQFRFESVS